MNSLIRWYKKLFPDRCYEVDSAGLGIVIRELRKQFAPPQQDPPYQGSIDDVLEEKRKNLREQGWVDQTWSASEPISKTTGRTKVTNISNGRKK